MQTVFVTGSSRGLGLEFCRQYVKENYYVIATCRQPENAPELMQLKQQHADTLEILPLDVTNLNAIKNLTQIITRPIDILINNAGIYGPSGMHFGDVNVVEWEQVLHTNMIAPLKICETLIEQVAKSERKLIVCVSSLSGSITDNQLGGRYIYRSSKAGLNMVARSMAIDLKPRHITVIAINPGWVKTDMGGENATVEPPERIKAVRKVINSATLELSGAFINHDGRLLPF